MTELQIESRVAVLETIAAQNRKDTHRLFKVVEDHMRQEEIDRKESITMITNLRLIIAKFRGYFLSGVGLLAVLQIILSILN